MAAPTAHDPLLVAEQMYVPHAWRVWLQKAIPPDAGLPSPSPHPSTMSEHNPNKSKQEMVLSRTEHRLKLIKFKDGHKNGHALLGL
jgi:hypothetical protein